MNCYDCLRQGRTTPAAAVCADCGAAVCVGHVHEGRAQARRNAGLTATMYSRRLLTCTACLGAPRATAA
ncbi:DUF2180 family protein [Streptomyces tremellae]|uniref:DUF2180 family protein n=1 Tax=Streptomyces tremellae TaxID=1124239 RepID=A0ABP7FBX3_9ACTN